MPRGLPSLIISIRKVNVPRFSSFKYIFVVFKCAFGNKRKLQGISQRNKPSKYLDCKSMFRVVLNVNGYINSCRFSMFTKIDNYTKRILRR
uniref:SJCHGC06977 protein n=1 Tax=Schistosoma japonicum TaxID=6182 RepID=Q5BRZ0_SCHJA|nr:SJCHGC06977 protein [Schistosoma japonicum]